MPGPPDDGVLKHMFGAFVQRTNAGGRRQPASSSPREGPRDELRRMATEHIRSSGSRHEPSSGGRDRAGGKSGTGFFGAMFGSSKPPNGSAAPASTAYRASGGHGGGTHKKGAKGGNDNGLPSVSTEDAPPRKRTRTLHRSQSAHAGTARADRNAGRLGRPPAHQGGAGTSERNFPCNQCPAAFFQKGQLSRHTRRVHEKLRPHACELCGSKFGARSDRSRHVQIVHNKTRNRTHACLYCEYAFQTKALRDNHMSKVHGKERERTFSCAECGFAFEQRANLQKHEREMHISRGAGKLTCSVCNANFDQKYDLRRHRKHVHGIDTGN